MYIITEACKIGKKKITIDVQLFNREEAMNSWIINSWSITLTISPAVYSDTSELRGEDRAEACAALDERFLPTRLHFSAPTPLPTPQPSFCRSGRCCIEVCNLKRHAACCRWQKEQDSFVNPVWMRCIWSDLYMHIIAALFCPTPLPQWCTN